MNKQAKSKLILICSFVVLLVCVFLFVQATLDISNILLNSASGNNLTSDNLTVSYTSNGTSGNFTDWRKNDVSLAVLNMPFDNNISSNATGAIIDYSTFGNNGTLGGGNSTKSPTWNSSGKIGGAYSFDGVDDYINCGNDTSLRVIGNTTWEFWLWRDAYNNHGIIITKGYANEFEIKVDYPANGDIHIHHGDGDYEAMIFSDANIPLNQWVHVGLVRTVSPKEMKLWVNGSPKTTQTYAKTVVASTNPVEFGRRLGGSYYLDGILDEVKIYNHSLSPEQIYANFIAGNESHSNNVLVSQETKAGNTYSVLVGTCDVDNCTTNVSNSLTVSSACVGATTAFRCGETITESCTLDGNLAIDGATCFTIGANNTIINGAGFYLNSNNTGIGISMLSSVQNISIKDCTFNHTDWQTYTFYGIQTINSTTNLTLINNTFINNTVGIDARNLAVGTINISDNFVYDGGAMFVISGQSKSYNYNTYILNNYGIGMNWSGTPATHNGQLGVRSMGGNVQIKNNNLTQAQDCTKLLVEIYNIKDVVFDNNDLTGREVTSNINTHFRLSDNTNITNNIFKWGTDGIALQDVHNVIIANSTFLNANHHSIIVFSGVQSNENISIIGNTLKQADYEGIVFDDNFGGSGITKNVLIENNYIENCSSNGIRIGYGANSNGAKYTIKNNIINITGSHGIYMYGNNVTLNISDVRIYNAGKYGINIYGRETSDINNISLQNIYIDGALRGLMLHDSGFNTPLNLVKNITIKNISDGIYFIKIINTTFQDITIKNTNNGLYSGESYNNSEVTFQNLIINNSVICANLYADDEILFKESIFENCTTYDIQIQGNNSDIHLLNSTFNYSKLETKNNSVNTYFYKDYYYWVTLLNETNNPINGTITALSNLSQTRSKSVDNTGNLTWYLSEYRAREYINETTYPYNVTASSLGLESKTIKEVPVTENLNRTFTLYVDTIPPSIKFIAPTPENGTIGKRSNLEIQTLVSDSNLANTTIFVYNETRDLFSKTSGNYSLYSSIKTGYYYFNATAYDTHGNYNQTETREINITNNGCVGSTHTYTCGDTIMESCTMNIDLEGYTGDCFTIGADNIEILGKGYNLSGTNLTGYEGIYIPTRTNVTIKDLIINGFETGIYPESSTLLNITNNTIVNNSYGIWNYQTTYSEISNNNITENSVQGYYMTLSTDNVVKDNIISGNTIGFFLDYSTANTITGNNMSSNNYNMYVKAKESADLVQTNFSDTNLVDGKKIKYIYAGNGTIIDAEADNIGMFIILSSTNLKISNAVLENNSDGIYTLETTYSTFTNITAKHNLNGIELRYQSTNNLINVSTFENNVIGAWILSDDNTVTETFFINNSNSGLYIFSELYSAFSGELFVVPNSNIHTNSFIDNYYGIYAHKSYNGLIYDNYYNRSTVGIYLYGACEGNNISVSEFANTVTTTIEADGYAIYYSQDNYIINTTLDKNIKWSSESSSYINYFINSPIPGFTQPEQNKNLMNIEVSNYLTVYVTDEGGGHLKDIPIYVTDVLGTEFVSGTLSDANGMITSTLYKENTYTFDGEELPYTLVNTTHNPYKTTGESSGYSGMSVNTLYGEVQIKLTMAGGGSLPNPGCPINQIWNGYICVVNPTGDMTKYIYFQDVSGLYDKMRFTALFRQGNNLIDATNIKVTITQNSTLIAYGSLTRTEVGTYKFERATTDLTKGIYMVSVEMDGITNSVMFEVGKNPILQQIEETIDNIIYSEFKYKDYELGIYAFVIIILATIIILIIKKKNSKRNI